MKIQEYTINTSENIIDKTAFVVNESTHELTIFVKNDILDSELAKIFSEFRFVSAEIEFEGKTIKGVNISGNKHATMSIMKAINDDDCSTWEALILFNKVFTKNRPDILKFRGDLAEAIFMLQKGGIKLEDSVSADVVVNGELHEIKSFSPQKRTITISLQQANENTFKSAIELKLSNGGKTITEIAQLLNDNKFGSYLLETYKNTYYDLVKYEITTPNNVSKLIPKFDFGKNIKKATIEIYLD